jgi:nitroreductase
MPAQPLDPDTLLSTTRAVRRRLDLTRPVEPALVDECLRIALQAPSSSNQQHVHFLVVTDPGLRASLADLYRKSFELYLSPDGMYKQRQTSLDPEHATANARVLTSAQHLAEHLHEVPVHVIPTVYGRGDGATVLRQGSLWGSVAPMAWSFMLAARARGLGTCWTTLHLQYEEEAAELLGIPFAKVMQAALVPVAHVVGDPFRESWRVPLERVVHRERW